MTARAVDEAISAIARRQFGVVARRQALQCGATPSLVRRRVAAGLWIRVADGVYRLRDFPPSWHASLLTAVLATIGTAVVSHEAAAAMHGLATFRPGRVVVTIRHGAGRQRHGVTVHQLDDLAPEHITTLDAIPVTTIARTLIDLAAVCRRGRVAYALEEALADELVTVESLCRCFDAVARPGKPGVRTLRVLLAMHSPGYVPPRSKLERLLLRVLRDGGLPRPRMQYPFPGRLPGESRVDAAFPEAKLIIGADSRRWHTRRNDFAVDRRRDNEATLAGWRTLRFTWTDLTKDPASVTAAVRAARETRLEAPGSAIRTARPRD
ncbi:MAG: type IV toxin-antitoxin system AbiEi family antitoxin domain-containing protein [Acidimicrobiia bacterium]